jgi:Protein of unknown function (DUF2950)
MRRLILGIFLMGFLTIHSAAQDKRQKTFPSAEEASSALVAAAKGNDERLMLEILGPDAKRIVSSGDDAEDTKARADFVAKYEEMHRLLKEPDGSVTLYIGAKNWPTPIPIVKNGDVWFFDTDAGKQEILYRRIGRNEISTIRVCQELVAAEKEYSASHQNEYAQKIVSDNGKQNGLYWEVSNGAPESPIGPLLAFAVAEEHAKTAEGATAPYRGYYFRILTRQGKNAPGGPKNYVTDGKMTEGFAFVAYPAEYRSSGVMTFIVGPDGVVYQKDLGKKTEILAKAMNKYDPGSSWQKADEVDNQTAEQRSSK